MGVAPRRAAVLYAVGDDGDVHGFLNFARMDSLFDAVRVPEGQRDLLAEDFEGAG